MSRKNLKLVAWFLIKFNLLAIPLYLALYFNFSFLPLQNFLAEATYSFLRNFNYNIVIDGNILSILEKNQFLQIEISWDSTGWKSLYALTALALATPLVKLRKKVKFLLVGLPILFIFNFSRIITTILVSVNYGFQYFDIVHGFLWSVGLITAVLGIWYIWLKSTIIK